MNNSNKEVQLLYIQLYGSVIFIITIIVSIILTYNSILTKTKNIHIFNHKIVNNINLINRITLTILTIVFTYINYEFYKINKQKNKGNTPNEELLASIITLIAAFLLLDATIKNTKTNNQTSNDETPLI